jgi:multidrug efflux pump subunit AcrA (membrane-fusion protein)
MHRLSTVTLTLLAAALITTGCGPRGRDETRAVQSVAVEPARRATVTRTTILIGTVVGETQATVMSKIVGKVTSIARREGSLVAEGDPILYVVNDIPGMDYRPGPVRAPVAGVVGKVYVEVGQTVGPTMPVATVAGYSTRVRVRAAVSDQDLRFIQPGALGTVTVSTWPDTAFAGRVTRITPVLDQLSRTATVELVVDNAGRRLIPGMSCSVRLVLEEQADVIAIPPTALFTNGAARVAVVEDSVARLRAVEIGLLGDRLVEVRSGVREDEPVITTGKERVADGDRVRVVEGSRQ